MANAGSDATGSANPRKKTKTQVHNGVDNLLKKGITKTRAWNNNTCLDSKPEAVVNFTVVSPWLKVELVMPWDESTLTANGLWSLVSAWSIDDCYITSAKWDMKYLKDMIDEQFPANDHVGETEVFEFPNAADGFLQVALPVGTVYEAASSPTKGSAPVEVVVPMAKPVFTGEAIPVLPAL